ncbi:MAG: hypothetical protein L6Q37_15740, partial [Bdellovibrionaceae bacterium]|nr:hypothetical protein [Pseudobdellovibrionaceae bacterium]
MRPAYRDHDINPDLILLEFPTDWFTAENLPNESTKKFLEDENNKDGGRDGQLAWKYCKTKKIPCAAFDIVGRNKFFKENQVFKRLDNFEKELLTYMDKNST